MAENLNDSAFWLPPQFLTDDDETTVNRNINSNNRCSVFNAPNDDVLSNSSVFNSPNDDVLRAMVSSDFSFLSSPVESFETESSDEEEHMAELTRRVAHSLELDLNHRTFFSEKPKDVRVSGSPKSSLCGFGNGCGCGGSSQGSPNSVCHVTSQRATWDLLRAAAGEVERMRLIEESNRIINNERHRFAPQRNSGVGLYTQQNPHHSLSHQQLQMALFQMLREKQMEKNQQGSVPVWRGGSVHQIGLNRGRNNDDVGVGYGMNNNVRGNMGLSQAAWPPLQQHGSGMRAIFLSNPYGKRECAGTGVFFPRRVDSPPEPRKKPTCSTVLVPGRVAEALNLNLDGKVPKPNQPRFNVTSKVENAATAIPRARGNYVFSQQRRNNLRPQPPVKHEMRLPQEWTY